MSSSPTRPRTSAPRASRLRLLAQLTPPAALVFGLLTVWLLVTTVSSLESVLEADGPLTGVAVSAAVVSLVLGGGGALVSALITYRLGVEVPRTLRGWQTALDERTRVLDGH